ncbi:MucBP domain-containing protein [Ligilactobacillus salivarius]|nr:MucBP domain-containing protein [Ligilactobacillus salivarius]ATP37507.1 hypothetical protein CR531_04865 [Ligilactobacillus salivarius]MDV9168076.1 MucBP domain-containing protein [Ligilactobacillus salivarius]
MYMQVCMGYAKEKELVKDKDYKIVKSGVMPHAYVVDLIGDYATTSSPIVVEYSGTVPAKNGERAVADQATTDVFVAYYEGDIVRSNERYTGPFSANWAEGVINVNNSSVTSSSQNVLGSVSVVHIDATTGKLLKPEAYVLEKDGTPLHNVEQGTKYKTTSETFSGYKFTTMGYDSAPAEGTVKEGHQRVIYLYVPEVKQKGNVDVTYVTEDGKVLEPTKYVVKDGKVGDDYTTEKNKFDGYKFKRMGEFSADAIGKVEEGTKHVVYVYAKTGNVDVKYVDTEGNVLPGGEVTPVKTNEEVGTEYGTTQKTFDGYHFVKMDVKSAPATGVVTAKDQHVIYVYEKDSETPTPEKKKGSVDVTYVAEDGKVLEPTKYVVKDGKVGDDYTTEKNKFDGYKFKRMGEFSADAIGKVEEGTKHVVYVYAKTGNVDVKYVDTEGNVLPGGEVTPVKTNEEVGTEYGTTQKTFDGYHFVKMDVKSAPATGVVTAKDQHVIYVYEKDSETPTPEKKKGSVDVTYVAEDGKVLEPTKYVVKDGKVGDDYTTEKNKFDGYKFKRMGEFSADATGKVEEGTKHVVYVYAKTGNVDVKYVDTEGNVLPGGEVTPVKTNEEVGTEYGTTQKTFDGYHFVKMDVKSAPATGVVTAKDQHVIYVYEKDSETPTPEKKKGSVDVTYVAEDGKVLEPTKYVVKDGKVGDDYTTEKNKFDGYKFKRMGEFSADAIGKVEEGTKHVVYVYAKTGNVDVKYVDTEGNVLPGGEVTPVKTNEEVGTEYGTTQKTFDGYHFVKMDVKSAPATGVVTAKDQHVIYVYEKDSETPTPEKKKGSVDVKYVTTDGKVLEDVTKVKDNVPVGEAYTTEEKSFDGYHFVGMDKTSDSANGKVTEGDKHIVYVYEKDPEVPTTPVEKKGSVYVKYVDENGNELPGGEKITVVKDGKVGSYYFTTEKDFDGYTFSHMAEGSSDPTGKVVEGDQQVVYVYTKNNTPQPEPNKPEVPTTPETPAVPQEEKTTTDTPVKTSTSKVNAEKVTVNKATVLPQTGDKKENNSSVMGLVSLGLAGLLGLGIKRKEEKDNH